ncbi:MAG: DUF4339 domain-containing protein [Verrucomicrobiia bacterium]
MQIFIVKNGNQTGPFSEDQIRSMLTTGVISADYFCWHEGLPRWVPVIQVVGSGNAKPPVIPKPDADTQSIASVATGFQPRISRLADKLNEVYRYTPQVVRWKCDPWMGARGMLFLREMGFRKPWLASYRDFIAGVLIENPHAYGELCSEIVLKDMMGGHGIDNCWDGAGFRMNLHVRQAMQSLGVAAFGPDEIGGGFIIQFDIEKITERFQGLLEEI